MIEKWKRLLVYQGGDVEALALASVELRWDAYGAEVRHNDGLVSQIDALREATLIGWLRYAEVVC